MVVIAELVIPVPAIPGITGAGAIIHYDILYILAIVLVAVPVMIVLTVTGIISSTSAPMPTSTSDCQYYH